MVPPTCLPVPQRVDTTRHTVRTRAHRRRRLIEAFLAGSIDDGEIGDVERAVRAEFAESDVGPESRPAVAVNLARRMDRDPTSGAAKARASCSGC